MRTINLALAVVVSCSVLAGCGSQTSGTSTSGLSKQPAAKDDPAVDPYERYANEMRERPVEAPKPVTAAPAANAATSSAPPAVAAPAPAPKAQ